jgi:hypothetical protein
MASEPSPCGCAPQGHLSSQMTNSSDRTVVHVLRHGEVHNPEGVLYGRLPDYHLSDRGRAMADRAAEALADRDIARVVATAYCASRVPGGTCGIPSRPPGVSRTSSWPTA